jgi:chromosome segregation ATPase
MSTNDFSQARGALANTISVIGPVLTALQQADTVFGVLANAEKHKKVLEAEVADYKAELEKTKDALTKSQKKLKDISAEIPVAEADADAKIKAVLEDEKVQIAAAKAQAAEAKAVFAVQSSAAQKESADKIAAAKQASDAVVAELSAKEAGLNASITALEKKLDSLRASAQKFAAALTGE